jgi:hypothetical protein
MDRRKQQQATDSGRRAHGAIHALIAAGASLPVVVAASFLHAEPTPAHKVEVGVSAGWLHRSAKTSTAHNPAGMSYGGAFGQTVQVRLRVANWLRVGAYYQRAYHTIGIPQGGVAPPGAGVDLDSTLAYSIGARLEPTIELSPRVRLWLILGAGWGRLTTPRMKVSSSTNKYTVMEREGVLAEFPMGIGGSFQVIPRWLAITFDTTIAPNYAQSGSLHEPTQYVDDRGVIGHTVPMPEIGATFAQMFGLSLLL